MTYRASSTLIITTAPFTQPAYNVGTVTVSVSATEPFTRGAFAFIENGGYYQILSVVSGTQLLLRNCGVGNLSAGSSVPAGSFVYPTSGPATSIPGYWQATDADTLLCWKLDEASGATTWAEQISGYTMSYANNAPTSGAMTTPWLSTAVQTNSASTGTFWKSTNSNTTTSTSFSMSIWHYPTSFSSDYPFIIGKQYRTNGSANGWTAPYSSVNINGTTGADGTIEFQAAVSGTQYSTTLTQKLVANAWQFLAITFNGTSKVAKFYYNGTLSQTLSALSGAIDWNSGGSPGPWIMGANANGGNFAKGYFADYRVYGVEKAAGFWSSMYSQMKGLP